MTTEPTDCEPGTGFTDAEIEEWNQYVAQHSVHARYRDSRYRPPVGDVGIFVYASSFVNVSITSEDGGYGSELFLSPEEATQLTQQLLEVAAEVRHINAPAVDNRVSG